ncbi:MAG: acyl-CoA dehydrogenase family protein [Nitrososphaerales archaeon]
MMTESQNIDGLRKSARLWLKDNVPSQIKGLAKNNWLLGTREIDAKNIGMLREWQRKVYEARMLGIGWPKEYGGWGGSSLEDLIVFEEFTQESVPWGGLGLGIPVVGPSLLASGTEIQKKKYVKRILTAEDLWSQGFSEPGAGSDLANISTAATDKGDYFEINGQKIWSSYAHLSDHSILLARTGEDRYKGLTMFIIDPFPREGITVRPIMEITGRGEFNAIFFDKVRVPKSDIIGSVGDGWKVAMGVLNNERLYTPFQSISISEKALKSLQQKKLPVEDLAQDLMALRMFYLRLFEKIIKGKPVGSESAVLKIVSSELLQRIYEFAVNSLPPEDLVNENWFQIYLASLSMTIGGGTSEILRNVVGERLLGLPK